MNIIKNNSELFVTGEIGYDFRAEDFIQQINSFSKDETIDVHIYSGGGSLFDALAVYDFVKLKGIKFNAYISGLSGSAATVIGAAAQNTYIGANSFYFVHRSISSNESLKATADERLIKIYQELTGQSKPTIRKILDAGDKGEFLSATQAIEMNFVNSVFKEAQLAASNDWYKDVLNNKINMEIEKIEEIKTDIVAKTIEGVSNFFTKKEKEVSSEALEKTVKDEVSNRVDDVVNSYEDKIKEINEAKENEVTELQNKVTELEAENSKLKGTETKVDNGAPKDPNGEEPKKSEWDIVANKFDNFLK